MNAMPENRRERPTLIEGLRPRQSQERRRVALSRCDATGRTDSGTSLHAECMACGAVAGDWRRLLGVGARVIEGVGHVESVLVEYPGACGKCGGCALIVRGSPIESEE